MDTVGIEPTTFHTRSQRRCEAKIIPLDQAPDIEIIHTALGICNISHRQFGRLDLKNGACWGRVGGVGAFEQGRGALPGHFL